MTTSVSPSRVLRSALAAVLLLSLAIPLTARAADTEEPTDLFDGLLAEMEWRCIGPARGGRATTCCGVIGDPLTYYMGATGGGVWKTVNAGITWEPISDDDFGTGSVGAVAVAPSDPNVVYVGMGERDPRGNFSHGDGMYRSTDAGETWTRIGLADSRQIAKIRVHPKDADLVYVAVLGHVYGPHEERGVYRSRDGGATWEQVLYVDDVTGAIDLALDPVNPRIMYAGFWPIQRSPWGMESGGETGGLYKSTDGGDTWEKLGGGLPEGITGKYGIAISPVDHKRVWVLVEADKGGIYRSNDGGETWARINEDRSLRQRAWYYTHIYADPKDVDTVYVLNVGFHKSTDGGRTFTQRIRVPHGDNHDLWINPDNPMNMVNANDGGANVSFDGGKSWTRQDMQPTAQFYHVTVDNSYPYRVLGAQQDNSTASISSRARLGRRAEFHSVGGGESGYIAVRPDDPDIVYAGSYGGYMTRYDHRTRTTRNITVWPENPMGAGADVLAYRFQWTFPIVISPHDPDVLYVAGNVLFRSTNEGQSWEVISPDLTTNDKTRQASSGGPITKDNTSVEYYCTIFAVAESPLEQGVIWAGTDDGLVHVTRDGGENWTNVTPPDLEPWSLVSLIEASPHDAGTAYLAVNRYKLDDFAPYVWKTTNYGATWRRCDAGIPDGAFVRAVREDPERRGMLYAGTETGVFVSLDNGGSWRPMKMNLPAVPITDLVVKDDDLVLGTQGRSFWILDDLTPLRQVNDPQAAPRVALMEPAPVHLAFGDPANVYYHLGDEVDGEVTIEVLDEADAVIRTWRGKIAASGDDDESESDDADDAGSEAPESNEDEGDEGDEDDDADEDVGRLQPKAGVNRFRWDTRYPDAERVPGAVSWGGGVRGPRAKPGTYTVRLTAGGTTLAAPVDLLADPRIEATDEDWAAQFALLIDIRDQVDRAHAAVNTIRRVRGQVNDAVSRSKDAEGGADVDRAGKALKKRLTEVEEAIIQTKSKSAQDPLNFPIRLNDKIAGLSGVVSRSQGRPTAQSYTVFKDLVGRLDVQITTLDDILASDVPRFNALVRRLELPAVKIE